MCGTNDCSTKGRQRCWGLLASWSRRAGLSHAVLPSSGECAPVSAWGRLQVRRRAFLRISIRGRAARGEYGQVAPPSGQVVCGQHGLHHTTPRFQAVKAEPNRERPLYLEREIRKQDRLFAQAWNRARAKGTRLMSGQRERTLTWKSGRQWASGWGLSCGAWSMRRSLGDMGSDEGEDSVRQGNGPTTVAECSLSAALRIWTASLGGSYALPSMALARCSNSCRELCPHSTSSLTLLLWSSYKPFPRI
jgi:hypothetical protein